MTAMSAPRASETPSIANSPATAARTVLLPGSPATYANRAVLRGLGLRWDPANHRWHGTTTADRVRELRERLGLVVKCFGDLEAPPKGPAAPKPAPPRPAPGPASITPAMPTRDPARRLHDGTRTRVEARVAIPSLDEEEEIPTPTRRFTVMEITGGLPDDSREADEKEAERGLRDLRGRVKLARAVVARTPGLAETLERDWRKAAWFCARFGISETMFRHGVPEETRSWPAACWEQTAIRSPEI